MAIKLLSVFNVPGITAGSLLKLDSNGNLAAAVAGTDYSANDTWSTASNSNIYYNSGGVRIGTYQSSVDAAAQLHVFDYQTTDPKVIIEDGNTGDASMQFKISTQQYTMGIDNSNSDKFIIAASSALGTTNVLEVATDGDTAFQKEVLFNEDVYFANDVNFNASGYNFTISSDTTTRTTLAWRINSVDSWAFETDASRNLSLKRNSLNTTGDLYLNADTRITGNLTVNASNRSNTINAGHTGTLNLIDTKTLILDDSFGTNDGRVFGVLQPAPFKPSDIILSDSAVASAALSNSVTNTFPNVKGEADATGITNSATFTFAEALAQAEALGGRLPTLEEILNGVGNGSGQGYDAAYLWTQTKAGHGKYWVAKGHGITYNDAIVVDINADTEPEYSMRIFYDISKDNMPVYYDNSSNIRATSIKAENSDGIALRALDGDIGITVKDDGNVKFNQYTAGLLKTDSLGNISLDTNTYLTSVSVDWSDIASINGTININSTTQIGQGDTETLVSFQNSGTERGSFEVDDSANSYFVATGFKTSTASTGFLKADGTVDTNTYSTATGVANNADVTPSWVPVTDPGYATTDYVDTEVAGLASESWANTNLVNVTGDTMTGNLTISSTTPPVFTLTHDGTNPSTNELLSSIDFDVDYDGSHQNWGKIELKTNASSVRTDMRFYVKSTSGNLQEALLLQGGSANPKAFFTNAVDVNGSITGSTLYTEGSVINSSLALELRSDVQHGQGDEDAVISFKQSTSELAKIDQGGYVYAAGFKVGSGSGVLRADGSTETITFGTMASANTSDYKTSDQTETYVGQELGSYTPTSSFGTNAFTSYTDHSTQGYLTSYTETSTLADVTGRGATTTNNISVGNLTAVGGTFTDPVTIYDSTTTENPRLSVGRNSGESIQFSVTDTVNTITAKQDSDSNSIHTFVLDRVFAGSGDSVFSIHNDGTPDLTIDGSGVVTLNQYGTAGILKINTSGTISVDTSSYLTSVAFSDLTSKPTTLSGYGIIDGASLGLDQVFTGDAEFEGDLLRTNQRISNNQEYPLGHYTPGETVFELDPTWSNRELRQYFGNSNVSWDEVENAPGGYAVYIDGSVSVGGAYNSGFPYIPIDQDGIYYMECWIKNAGTGQGHYMGSMDYEADLTHPSSGGGNPGSYGYFVMSNYTGAAEWTKRSGYITGHHNSNTGAFETDATYWTPQALFNYSAGTGTRACWISGWKVIRVDHVGDRTFQDSVFVKGKLEVHTLDTNTTSTTALVMNGNEVEKRTLGSLAFNSTTLGTAASAATTDFATAAQGTNADTAHGWGNHASVGYLTTATAAQTYAPLASPALTGTPTAPTAAASTNTTQIATTAFVQTAVSNLVDSAPATLDTLNELAAALGDDANFSTTVTNSLAGKLSLSGGSLTGDVSSNSVITADVLRLTNDATDTSRHRIAVYDSGTTSYGMMLWNASGTSSDWATMIYGPNQDNRRISFGKITGDTFTSHGDVTEIAHFDLDDSSLNLDGALNTNTINVGDTVTLTESTDRADLLYINSGTSSWGGLQIGNTSNEFIFSLMGNGNEGGIYDDANSDWMIRWYENGGVQLNYLAEERIITTSQGVRITGATSGTASENRGFAIPKSGLGAIHITGAQGGTTGSADTVPLITFPGSSNVTTEVQGGIYLSQNSSTGTSVAIATTDSYSAGPKLGLEVYDNGDVKVSRGKLFIGSVASTTGTEALMLVSGEVKSRTLGSNAFNSTAYLEDITPATPSVDSATVVGETIEITFSESSTPGVDYYQVWSAVGSSTGSYGLIAHIPQEDVASSMTVIDATFSVSDTMYYRVYAVKSGIYSTAGTTSRAFSASALDVANMSVVNLNTAYYIQYEMPDSRFVDHVEIYMDAEATASNLTRTGATLVYSGNNTSYMYKIGANDLDKYHQFWVEVIES